MKDADLTKEILEFLVISGGISLLLVNPALLAPAILLANHLPRKDVDKKRISNALYYLQKRKYVTVNSVGEKTTFRLTVNGAQHAKLYLMESKLMSLKKNLPKWNGKWYLVTFDVKDDNRIKRDALRRVLRRSGFKLLQKSVWIYPYDCRSEIDFVKNLFRITDEECRVIASSHIGDDQQLRKAFNLK